MLNQKENHHLGPFRATRLWDEAVRVFTHGMPRKRHRLHMRLYENSFTGSEAIKWFYQALQINPHFCAVITQEKTHQLLNKFYEEDVFVKVRDSGRDGEHFKLNGLYQMSHIAPQHTARTPLSTTYLSNHNDRSENWIRRSLHKEPLTEVNNIHGKKNVLRKYYSEENVHYKFSALQRDFSKSVKTSDGCGSHNEHCSCKSSGQSVRTFQYQHPLQPRQEKILSPSHDDDVWREVFRCRLQKLLPDLDVSGLLWPLAIIRCQWLEQNCSLEDLAVVKLPPWVKASTNRLLQALLDKTLNRSVVNLDIEADVSALEAYFCNIQSSIIPADLCALFLRVFLHLETIATSRDDIDALSIDIDQVSLQSDASTESSCILEHHPPLPPNTCFETAFTSASPVTRIVPQCSFDTLHLRPASACTLTKRNTIASKLSQECSKFKIEGKESNKSLASNSSTELSDSVKYLTLGKPSVGNKQSTIKTEAVGGSLPRKSFSKTSPISQPQDCRGLQEHHNCGQLKVVDKTPPNYRARSVLRKPLEKHGRSHSGGYVNLGLQDSFEAQEFRSGELDLEAAMESLNKLILCSKPSDPNKSHHHVRSASLSNPENEHELEGSEIRRSQSCWSQSESIASVSSSVSVSGVNSKSISSSSPAAGCEWGWDWGSDVEMTGVSVYRLLTLLLPPQSRKQFQLLLQIMGLLPYQCPYTTIKVLEMFSSCIMSCGDEVVTVRILGFFIRHHQEIFVPPEGLVSEVEKCRTRQKTKDRAAVTFCERISLLQFEEQKLTSSQKALAELLDQIIDDEKMNMKEKTKKLKMFKEAYPHIYALKFPNAEAVSQKNRNKSILQLARLRSLRV